MEKELGEKIHEKLGHDVTKIDQNNLLFYDFMVANGFNPKNCESILELIQSVRNSISQYLKKYNHFLLSENVTYSDLEFYNINGACGYIEAQEGIIIPKSIKAYEYFRNRQSRLRRMQIPRYIYPSVSELDTVIAYLDYSSEYFLDIKIPSNIQIENLRQITSALSFNFKNNYFGFITDKDDEKLSQKIKIFTYILEELNHVSSQEHMMVNDTLSSHNKEFYLVKKR